MRITSKCAVIFGVMFFIIGCGTENVIGICAATLLAAFGAQAICFMKGT